MADEDVEAGPYKIQNFVFLDFKTLDATNDQPRILEISMIAVSREDLLNMKEEAHSNNPSYARGEPLPLPKFCMKYSMLYSPKTIYPFIEEIAGLSNYNLNHLKSFDEDSATAIKLFLDLPPPVGIVAHNGYGFDFPILKAELMGVHEENLKGVVCIDSLEFSLYFEKEDIKIITMIAQEVLDEDIIDNDDDNTSNNSHGVNGYSPSKLEGFEDIPSCSSAFTTFDIHLLNNSVTQIKMDSTKNDSSQTQSKKLRVNDSIMVDTHYTPPNLNIKDSHQTQPPHLGKNGLSFFLTKFTETPVLFPELIKQPFSLPHIFYRIYGQKYFAHRAESDAEALLQICAYHGQDFVKWADINFIPFRIIKPRWHTKRKYFV